MLEELLSRYPEYGLDEALLKWRPSGAVGAYLSQSLLIGPTENAA